MDLRKASKSELKIEIERLHRRIFELEEQSLKKEVLVQKSTLRADIVESSGEAVIGLTVDSNIITWNKAAELIYGYTSQEVFGLNVELLVPPEHRRMMLDIYGKVTLGQRVDHFETVHLRKDGTSFHTSLSAFPIFNNSRKFIGQCLISRDITEQKLAREALRESEEKYRSFFEHSRDAILLTRPDGTMLDANEAACEMFGGSLDEIKKAGRRGLSDGTDPRLRAALEERDRTGVMRVEIVLNRINGDRFPAEITSAVFTDSNGEKKTSMIIRDITERKKTEEDLRVSASELRKTQEILTAAVNSINESLVMIARDGTILLSNTVGAGRLEKDLPEFVGTCLYDHFPTDVAAVRKKQYDKVFKTGKYVRFEDARSGRHYEQYVYPVFDEAGEVSRAVVFAREISDRKEAEILLRRSEERYRSIFENVVEGVFQTEPEGHFINVNPAMAYIHGYGSPEEMISEVNDIGGQLYVNPEDRVRYSDILRGQGAVMGFEAQVYRRDGSVIWTSTNARAIKDGGGDIINFEGTVVDITKRKHAEIALKTSYDHLHKLTAYLQRVREEEQKRISREIHDELGQALTGIKIDLSRLKRQLVRETNLPSHFLDQFDELMLLASNTIKVSRTLSSSLRPSVLDDLGLVAALKWYAKRFSERTGIRYTITCQPEDICDDQETITALFRIYQECLTNIVRHAEADAMTVRLTQDEGMVTLEVSDNGKGMSDERLGSPESFGIRGMKERAIVLGGTVDISSRPGRGTLVRAKIPVKEKGILNENSQC